MNTAQHFRIIIFRAKHHRLKELEVNSLPNTHVELYLVTKWVSQMLCDSVDWAHQAPQPRKFSRTRVLGGWPFSSGISSGPGMEPENLHCISGTGNQALYLRAAEDPSSLAYDSVGIHLKNTLMLRKFTEKPCLWYYQSLCKNLSITRGYPRTWS